MKTTLFKALQAADEIHVDGHDTDGMDESDSTMEINVLDGTCDLSMIKKSISTDSAMPG